MYCDGDIIPSYERITISENMSLDVLRKIFFDVNGSCRILLDFFYCQSIYVGDDCVEYDYMQLKRDDDVRNFSIYLKFNTKFLIKLKSTFGFHSR